MSEEVREFELSRKEVPIRLGDEDHYLIEMDGKERDRYLNIVMKRTAVQGDRARVKDFTNLQGVLVQACLKRADKESTYTLDEIAAFPSSVQTGLFEICQELNGLKDDEEEGGND